MILARIVVHVGIKGDEGIEAKPRPMVEERERKRWRDLAGWEFIYFRAVGVLIAWVWSDLIVCIC